jgi:isocitrate/isopropylmalate dehydrogenase
MAHRVTLIPGDDTGPELTEATRRALEATGVEFEWDVQHAGTDVMDENDGNPLPEHVLESIRRNGTALNTGNSVTYDMKPSRDVPTAVGTSEVANAIIKKLEVLP